MDDINEATCALWYWRYHVLHVSLFTSEMGAAREAVDMVEEEYGSPDGIQFSDGRVLDRDNWTLYKELSEARSAQIHIQITAALAAEAKNPPPPPILVKSPFDSKTASIHGVVPEWVGVH